MFEMVGFDPRKKNLTKVDYTIASCASSVATRFVGQPFDVLKIRFQLQVEPISKGNPNSKYRSLSQATLRIAKEEGLFALWKGHIPGQVLSLIYGTTQFPTFEYLTKLSYKYFHQNNGQSEIIDPAKEAQRQILTHLVCGSLAGCVATFCSFPFDVIRTRLISQGQPKVYSGMFDAACKMATKEGPVSFYRGLVPSLIQIMPFSGLVFGFNRIFKQLWHEISKKMSKMQEEPQKGNDIMQLMSGSVVESAACGSLAGFCSKSIVYPLDLLKKRLQVQGFGYARKEFGAHHDYRSMCDGIKQILRTESLSGFYKGFYPSVMKSGASTGIQFVVYEQMIRILIMAREK